VKMIDAGQLQKALLQMDRRGVFNLENVLEVIATMDSHSACIHPRYVNGIIKITNQKPDAFWVIYDRDKQIIFDKESFDKQYTEMQKHETH